MPFINCILLPVLFVLFTTFCLFVNGDSLRPEDIIYEYDLHIHLPSKTYANEYCKIPANNRKQWQELQKIAPNTFKSAGWCFTSGEKSKRSIVCEVKDGPANCTEIINTCKSLNGKFDVDFNDCNKEK